MKNNLNLQEISRKYKSLANATKQRIIICAGTGCIANGSLKIYEEFIRLGQKYNLNIAVCLQEENTKEPIHLSGSGCQGFCQMGPLVTITPQEILYTKVKVEDVEEIINETLINNRIIERLLYVNPVNQEVCKGQNEIPFYKKQQRFVIKECGVIDPEDIREYISHQGYMMAEKAYKEMSDKNVCDFILASGLRGRGGGGFPTGKKWDLTRIQPSSKKFVICNGDEGDPGAFMDRSVMEGNPHSVIEGMLIAARAIGASEGYVYVRAEYPLAVKRMRNAVKQAKEYGILGDNIFNSKESFHLTVMEGAGAFVCGEETALMASIEGSRGMPNPKPPFPAQKGLQEKPTVINNVETLATVPLIMKIGIEAFRKIGTPTSPGTKTFALTGHVVNTGLIEVPFGTTLKEIVIDIGGGVISEDGTLDNSLFKAVQIGGPSGGCLTEEHMSLPLDFDSLTKVGAMVGSGGLVVTNKSTCMVSFAKYFMQFTQNESCGKCVPCREGTKQMLALLNEVTEGSATEETLKTLQKLGNVIKKASLCGLGKTAPNPVLSTMKYFGNEYNDHVVKKTCLAKTCKSLLKPEIDPVLCKGCTLCAKKCPVSAITGTLKNPHKIDESKCIKCGVCVSLCKFKAVGGM